MIFRKEMKTVLLENKLRHYKMKIKVQNNYLKNNFNIQYRVSQKKKNNLIRLKFKLQFLTK